MKKNSFVVVLRVALGVALWFAVIMVYSYLIEPMLPDGIPAPVRRILRQMVIPYTVGLAGFYLIAGKMEKKNPRAQEKVTPGLLIKSLIIQTGISIPVTAVIGILITILGGTVNNTLAKSLFGANWLFNAVLLLVFNPIMEEVLFRKLVLERLLILGDNKAIIISAVLFAIPHAITQGIPPMVGTFIIALVWGYLRVKTGKLWPCMVLHGCFNLISGYITLALSRTPAGSVALVLIFILVVPVTAVILLLKHFRRRNP